MDTPQQFIEQLYKESSSYQYPSQAENLANSLDTISDDIYSESERFVYELIQNADDACSDQKSGVEIHIEFTPNFIVISHTGREFSEADIKAISSVGNSQKTKNSNQTGYKGIGFKSVFGKSDLVYINSNKFSFRFDKNYWEKEREHKMPWQIIPIWCDNFEQELSNSRSFDSFPVSTAIRYENPTQLKEELSCLFSDTQIMLFLRNVKKITVDDSSGFVVDKIRDTKSNTVTIKKNGHTQSEWIVKDFTNLSIPEEIQIEINKDDKTPKKLKESKFTNISFAAKIVDGKLKRIENESIIFTYLPTKINWKFPFLVNADFLTNAAREAFHEDRFWNEWLFKMVAVKIFEWVAELAKTQEYKYQITSLIPNKLNSYSSNLKYSFNMGFDSALKKIAFIPNQKGDLLKANEALIDRTGINKIIGSDKLTQYCNKRYLVSLSDKSFVNSEINNIEKIINLDGVFTFDSNKLNNFLQPESLTSFINLTNNYAFIKFLYSNSELLSIDIQNLTFILDQKEILVSPNNIYIPVQNFEFSLEELRKNFQFIHESVWKNIHDNPKIEKWLRNELNIKEPTEKNIIQRTILRNLQALSNTPEKSLKLVRYLFDAHRSGILGDGEYSKLHKIKLIIKSGELKSAFLGYLSDKYQPRTPLEQYLSKDIIVSEKYTREKDSIKDWNNFFTKIGVQEKIALITSPFIYKRPIIENFDIQYVEYVEERHKINNRTYYIDRPYFENFKYIPWIQEIQNYQFSKEFWRSVIPCWSQFINQKTQYYININNRNYIDIITHFEYFITHEKCIPTTREECYQHDQVILNQENFKIIGGDFLPILDLEINLPKQVIEFFSFRTEITLGEYLDTLGHISQQEYKKEDIPQLIKRIELIYEALVQFDQDDKKEKIREWGKVNKILATDNNFYLPQDLSCITLDRFEISTTFNHFVRLPKQNTKTIELLKILGVVLIGKESLEFKVEGKHLDNDLTQHLTNRLPLIALVMANKNSSTWSQEFDNLEKAIDGVEFYRANEINISLNYGDQETIRQKQYSCLNQNNIYYVGNWNSPRSLFSLIDNLSDLLKINKLTKELNLLLLEEFDSCLEWLKELGYDISLIPEDYRITSCTVKTESNFHEPEQRVRTSAQEEYDSQTGRLGEEFVYERLKKIYQKKYSIDEKNLENTRLGFKIKDIEIIWNNREQESGKDHDFKIINEYKYIKNNKSYIIRSDYFIEVKSTTTNENDIRNIPFYFSINEWNLMDRSDNNYYIARVFNARTKPSMKLIKFQDEIG